VYDAWLGIKFFWGPQGPLQSGQWSDTPLSACCRAESSARSLSQTQIDKYKGDVGDFLIKATDTSVPDVASN
jgi:hypothetical protein